MKIMIDIGHPAHVHLFKHFAWEMQEKGHVIFFTCRDKEFESYLLEKYGFSYKSFGKKYASRLGKLLGLIEFDVKAYLTALKFKPDIFLSHGSIYAAHAAFLMGKPHISLEDTFNFEQINLYKPFTKVILTGDYVHPLKSDKKVVSYSGYHELAYLHPNRFTPDRNVLKNLGLNENEKYVILRFVSWKASHDIGHKGIHLENKIRSVREFEQHARVFISSEAELSEDLKKYKIPIAPEKMHDAIAFASLVVGESFTLLAEAAVLGTPAVLIHNTKCYYLQEHQQKYGLTFNFTESDEDQTRAIEKSLELLKTQDLKQKWARKRAQLLFDKIDVTAFMVWFIENYPQSVAIMQSNPDYQFTFK